MLTLVNPIGVTDEGASAVQMGVAGASLGAGAAVGYALGDIAYDAMPDVTGMPVADDSLKLVAHLAVAWGIGAASSGISSDWARNLRAGIQAGILSPAVLRWLNALTGGAVGQLLVDMKGALSGYLPTDFGGQGPAMASLKQPLGNQYLGADYGRDARRTQVVKIGAEVPTQYSQDWLSLQGPDDDDFYA